MTTGWECPKCGSVWGPCPGCHDHEDEWCDDEPPNREAEIRAEARREVIAEVRDRVKRYPILMVGRRTANLVRGHMYGILDHLSEGAEP